MYAAFHEGQAPCATRGNDVSEEHWEFIQQCWTPFNLDLGTSSRPSAEEACEFMRKELEFRLVIAN